MSSFPDDSPQPAPGGDPGAGGAEDTEAKAPDGVTSDEGASDEGASDEAASDEGASDEGASPGEVFDIGDVPEAGPSAEVKQGTTKHAGKAEDLFRLNLADDLSGLETLLSDDFARISGERDEFLDALKRLQADFDNFRKRTERQQAELRGRATEALVVRLLPVLDSLDLAIAHLGLGGAPPADEASSALLQVATQLRDLLAREGLERIDAVGVGFDPTVHEATAMDDREAPAGPETEDGEPAEPAGPTVTEVWRSGYRIGDRVIRPAMVRVRG